jgi:hypothetical protein
MARKLSTSVPDWTYDYIEQERQALGVDRSALINAMLTVAARRPAEVLAQVRKTAMLEKRQEQK